MNTKLIMTSAAIFLVILGLSLTFAPDKLTILLGVADTFTSRLVLQLLGASYCGYAMLNWMAKGSIIGGIYNKPLVTANLTHFVIGGLALVKALSANHQLPSIVWVIAGCYVVFAVLFGMLFSRHPGKPAV